MIRMSRTSTAKALHMWVQGPELELAGIVLAVEIEAEIVAGAADVPVVAVAAEVVDAVDAAAVVVADAMVVDMADTVAAEADTNFWFSEAAKSCDSFAALFYFASAEIVTLTPRSLRVRRGR